MSNKKISELTDDTSVTLADYVPIVSPGSSQTKKASLARVIALAGSSGGGSGAGVSATFLDSFVVNLPDNRTGIPNGTLINAGDPIAPFLKALTSQATPPAVSVSTSANTQNYNQTNIALTVNLGYTILTSGATFAHLKLERSRDNTTWLTLADQSSTASSYPDSGINPTVDNRPIYYRLTITDTAGGTNSATGAVTFAAYQSPTVTGFTAGTTPDEKGAVNRTITGTINRVSPNIDLASYQLEYQVNGTGTWTGIGSVASASAPSQSFSVNHNDSSLSNANAITYRVKVTDAQQVSYVGSTGVTFNYKVYYGPTNATLTTANIKNQLSSVFLSGAVTNFLTGGTSTNFYIAVPPGHSLATWVDLTSSGADLTGSLTNTTIPIPDGGTGTITYTLYKLTTGAPYDAPGDNFQFSIA